MPYSYSYRWNIWWSDVVHYGIIWRVYFWLIKGIVQGDEKIGRVFGELEHQTKHEKHGHTGSFIRFLLKATARKLWKYEQKPKSRLKLNPKNSKVTRISLNRKIFGSISLKRIIKIPWDIFLRLFEIASNLRWSQKFSWFLRFQKFITYEKIISIKNRFLYHHDFVWPIHARKSEETAFRHVSFSAFQLKNEKL